MLKTTQAQIRNYLNRYNDLNTIDAETLKEMKPFLECVALSFGVYGMNAGLFRDTRDSSYYVVPNRSTRLFELV